MRLCSGGTGRRGKELIARESFFARVADKAVKKARGWKMATRQAANIAGSTVRPESGAINALNMWFAKARKERLALFACGKPGHFACDNECPARGNICARCGKRCHWASCCGMKKEAQSSIQCKHVRQVQCED